MTDELKEAPPAWQGLKGRREETRLAQRSLRSRRRELETGQADTFVAAASALKMEISFALFRYASAQLDPPHSPEGSAGADKHLCSLDADRIFRRVARR
jgi:hypothetical protein